MSLTLVAVIAGLYGIGVWLVVQRALTRILLGIALIGHASVLLLQTAGGRAGRAPFADGSTGAAGVADPIPQALALTGIVITFGVICYLLALALRSWTQRHTDDVEDDIEDRHIAHLDRRETADRDRT